MRTFPSTSGRLAQRVARIAGAGIAAAACLAAGSAAFAAADPIGSEHFVAGWQSQTHAMINRGVTTAPGRAPMTVWYVPPNLPRGHYLVINRTGDKAEVINGYAFDIDSDSYRDINVFLPQGYGYVEALPDRFVPEVKRDTAPVRFEGQ
jgi:hypothetical protein